MKKGLLILLFGLIAGAAGFAGFYHFCTAPGREMLSEKEPELVWLKKEFNLSDAELARVAQLHEAYLPACAERCRVIEVQNSKLKELLAHTTTVTPEIETLLVERAKTRADCESAMLKHFVEVSHAMPPEQGRRYLAWVQEQTCLRGQPMEKSHEMTPHEHQ